MCFCVHPNRQPIWPALDQFNRGAAPHDLAELPSYEQAREHVFRAFGSFWLGLKIEDNEYYFTGFADFKDKEKEDMEAKVLQVGSLRYHFTKSGISPAEKLNGITYKGNATFTFGLYRTYAKSLSGWTDWKDTEKEPPQYQNKLSLSFTIEQRDTHWSITTDNDTVFLDDHLKSEPKSPNLILPSKDIIIKIATEGDSPRKRAKEFAEKLKEKPSDIPAEAKETADTLRRRPLR
jgi:hypothetical protein